jgi:hypothetical protein
MEVHMDIETPTEAPVAIGRSSRPRSRRSLRAAVVVFAGTAFLASAALASAHDGGMGGFGRGFGDGGSGFGRGGVGGQITITAVNGNDLALKTTDGWTRTITVTSATTITEAGQTIAVGDLDVGDTIRFSQTANSDGTYTIDAIVVVVPTVSGTVTEVGSGSFKLTARDGTTWTITTNTSTAYKLGFFDAAKAGSASDVKVGTSVVVQGTSATNNAMTAVTVRIQLPRVGGQVTAKTADTITVSRRDGTTVIHVSSSTTYQVVDKTSATLADITVGMTIMAEGTQRSDGSIDATTVVGGIIRGGHGWFGREAAPSASPSGTIEADPAVVRDDGTPEVEGPRASAHARR